MRCAPLFLRGYQGPGIRGQSPATSNEQPTTKEIRMKKLYLPLLTTIILLLASNIPAVEITYNVTSGGKSSSLTTDYDLSEGSRADSQIDITSNPSISSHTTVSTQGNDNDIAITTGANDGGGSTSNASVRIFDAVDTASINTNANASNSTSASVNATGTGATAGIIKGESDGTKQFCGFTGDFTVSSNTGGGNVAIASSYTNPKANLFYVSKDPTPCHNPVYDDIQPAVDDASHAGGLTDYIFVDHGGFTGAEIDTKSDLTLSGVWGADNTTVNGKAGGGDTLYVHDSDNFTVEGFTVTGGTSIPVAQGSPPDGKYGNGIGVYNGLNTKIKDNTATGNQGAGIGVLGSKKTQIKGNTASGGKGWAGIGVYESIRTRIECNTASGNENNGIDVLCSNYTQIKNNTANENDVNGINIEDSKNTQIKNNTANENDVNGIIVKGSNYTKITGNTANENDITGIRVLCSDNTRITGNTASGNENNGIDALCSNYTQITGNTVNENVGNGIIVKGGNYSNITGNTASGNENNGIGVLLSNDTLIKGNTASGNENNGIDVLLSNNTKITGNTVNGNENNGIGVLLSNNTLIKGNTANENDIAGIGVLLSNDTLIKGNTVSENEVGVHLGFLGKAKVTQNNIVSNNVGLQNDTGKKVNAKYNWWGPGGTGADAGKPGVGGNNGVAGNVTFKPWSPVKF